MSEPRATLDRGLHTPGPWYVEERINEREGWQVWCRAGMRIAATGHAESFDLANARLIAAAPELLKVADLLYDAVDMMTDGPDDSDVAYAEGKLAEAFKLARELRKQVRGEG